MTNELWRQVWRRGFAPQLSVSGLLALEHGLRRDDFTLVQGMTLSPPALDVFADAEVEASCGLTYSCWKGDGVTLVAPLAARFEELCLGADERLGEPGICRFFLDWFDNTPRSTMRRQLLEEVSLALKGREPALAK